MGDVPWPASKRRIDLAGERVSAWWFDFEQPGDLIQTDAVLQEAGRLLFLFRLGFQGPLNKVTMGVRTFVQTEGHEVVVTQRLKRFPTIVGKLNRHPGMKLSRVQDIGGCRAILPDRAAVEHVLKRMRRQWEIRRLDDYVMAPKGTGYRAVHAVVVRDGRPVEVQLRTPLQQAWAGQVDRIASQLGTELKDGDGPEDLVRFLRLLSDRAALTDGTPVADDYDEKEFRSLWPKVRTFFETR